MAKLFYTLQDACAKLGKTEEEISQMVTEGKLREFRDHEDKLMFKIQEVDLLAGDSGDSMELDLGSDIAPVDGDSFELDLDGEGSKAGTGRSASPVGPGHDAGGADDGLTLELDLDGGGAAAAPKQGDSGLDLGGSAAAKSAAGSAAPFELDLDLDEAPAAKPAPPAPKPAAVQDEPFSLELGDEPGSTAPKAKQEDSFALDLDESAAGAPKASAKGPASDELTLELDLGEEPAPAKSPAKGGLPADSLGSLAAAKAASGGGDGVSLEGSNMATSPDGSSISDRIGIDGVSSGSGLMDLTNESESSSIGAALMDEAFSSDEAGEIPANASGIFGGSEGGESGADMAAVGAVAGAAAATAAAAGKGKAKTSAPIFTSGPSAPEAYSGSWSGLGVGLLLPASLGLGAAAAMVVAKALGAPPELALLYAKDWMMYTGAFAGVIAVSGVIGFFVGKATE